MGWAGFPEGDGKTPAQHQSLIDAALEKDKRTQENLRNAVLGEIGHSRDHLQHIDVIVAEARKNGTKVSFDGTDGEIVHLGDRTGKIGADEKVKWIDPSCWKETSAF